jgi:hypothetical protein
MSNEYPWKNTIAIGPGMTPIKDQDIVLGDASGSFLRVTSSGDVYVNQLLVAKDDKIHASLRTAIGCCVTLPPLSVAPEPVGN